MSSLFNVFESGDEDVAIDTIPDETIDNQDNAHVKRPHSDGEESPIVATAEDPHAHHQHSRKQTRLDQPKPILADAFETQAETEFMGASVDADTGTAVVKQQTVKLQHQVSLCTESSI
jgi:hypothetical protein